MSLSALALPLTLALSAPASVESTTAPTSPRLRVGLGLSSKMLFRVATVDDGNNHRTYGPALMPLNLELSLHHYFGRDQNFHSGGWRGAVVVSVNTSTPMLGLPVGLEYQALREWKVGRRASLVAGASLGAYVNFSEIRYSHLQLGAPLGLSSAHIDLLYTPALTLPLAVDRRSLPHGEFRRTTAVHLMPFHVTFRVKFGKA